MRQIKSIASYDECEAFVRAFRNDSAFSDPMLSSEEQLECNLIKAIEKPEDRFAIGVFDGQRMTGLFSFLALREEKYLEMLAGLSRDEEACETAFAYLEERFPSFEADFVFNPRNGLLRELLRRRGAEFETEQQKMVHVRPAPPVDTSGVELLTEEYIPSYLEMHSTDVYWTGEKVIKAPERFRTFAAVEDEKVIGYLDVTYCFDENEPYDLLVREEHRRKGWGRKLLAKALEMNAPKGMMMLADVDNDAAIRLYESMGFEKAENQNSLTAHWKI